MKFFGKVGFVTTIETEPGIWTSSIEEHDAYGDVISNVRRWEQSSETVNSSVTTSNQISIVADRFLCEHMGMMRYIRWNGTVWEIRSVNLVRPRAIITLGGVYNGEKIEEDDEIIEEGPSNDGEEDL